MFQGCINDLAVSVTQTLAYSVSGREVWSEVCDDDIEISHHNTEDIYRQGV